MGFCWDKMTKATQKKKKKKERDREYNHNKKETSGHPMVDLLTYIQQSTWF